MSDARWLEIDTAVGSAVRHFAGAEGIFARLSEVGAEEADKYLTEMAFLHAMQAGHTSLESALLRILEMFGEEAPIGARWHADLIRRVTRAVDHRPPVLTGDLALAADETRQFRNVAARAYDDFDRTRAQRAVAAAGRLAAGLAGAMGDFRRVVDP